MELLSRRQKMNTNPNDKPANQIRAESTETLPPVDRRSAEWFPRLGYNLSEAIADLIDNSLDAKATKAWIRIVRTEETIQRVLIADNGDGMTARELAEAMRFGGGRPKPGMELGKYGIGLKLASLSQAKTVTVMTRQGNQCAGRRWRAENIARGWICEILAVDEVTSYLSTKLGDIDLRKKGTVVIWEDLEHLKATPTSIDATIQKTVRDLSHELGLRFHRFIANMRLQISIDAQLSNTASSGVFVAVKALDPFSYATAGKPGYPISLPINLIGTGKLTLECHIWPPNTNAPGYKLGGGKVSARQGFYFYRNDRLIQAGGWNHCRDDDSEPHLSLARVRIDLPSSLDGAFKLDIKKSGVEPPPTFSTTVNSAVLGASSFKQFTTDAQAAYRKEKAAAGALFPFLPNKGFPAGPKAAARRLLREKGDGHPSLVDFIWDELDPDKLIGLDRNGNRLVLNNLYRNRVLESGRASATDAALVKMLLLLLLQPEMSKKAVSARSREWLQKVNHVLVATLKKER